MYEDLIFDSHAHYDDDAFNEDRDELLSSLYKKGIGYIVDPGSSMDSSLKSINLADKYPFVYSAIGLHPDAVAENTDDNLKWLRDNSNHEKVVAIGEIGLDYHYEPEKKNEQIQCFEAQMDIAQEKNMPVIIHSREAAKDTLDIMKSMHAGDIGGVVHCFSYGKEMAREYLNMGMYIGVGGVLTFKNAKKLKEVVDYLPLDRILLETDCPYMTPVPNRGKRNSSLNLTYVANAISEIKNISVDEVIRVTCKNAMTMYRISEK